MGITRLISIISKGSATAFLLTAILVSPAPAQEKAPQLRAAAAIVPPFVMEQNGSLTGFSIDLWNAIGARLKLNTSYQIVPDAKALDAAIRTKQVDVVVTPVVITAARDAEFDFSYPIVEAGLRILVRDTGRTAKPSSPLRDLLYLLLSPMILVWLGISLLLVLIPAHVIWLLERGRADGVTQGKSYFPGIFYGMAWAATALVTQVQELPNYWIARVIALIWMFAGVVFVAFYTAELTTTLTIRQIRGAIEGPSDLPGKQVATVANSTAAEYLREHNAQVQEYQTLAQTFQALRNKKVDAVVFGDPYLLYYAAHDGKGLVKTVGPEFDIAPVAFAFQLGSPLRKKVNGALLALRENDTYEQLRNKWFGAP